MRLLTKFEGGLQSVHNVDNVSLNWLKTTAAKMKILHMNNTKHRILVGDSRTRIDTASF